MAYLSCTPSSTGTQTALFSPSGVSSYDASGSFYISDSNNRVIRRVFPNATTRVVVGLMGSAGTGGNWVLGTTARANYPRALTMAAASGSTLMITDSGAHMIRMLYPNQTIRTFMGVGASGYSGDLGPGECLISGVAPTAPSYNSFSRLSFYSLAR